MSNIELHDLRMQEFPHYVRLALNKLEMCVQSQQSAQIISLQGRLIEEFIFCSHDTGKPNNKHVKILTLSVNELTVVRMIISHLTTVTNDPLRNTLLMRLFHPSNMDKSNIPNQFNCDAINNQKISHRLNILASLCSLSLASKNTKVLESIAVWMQQVCNLSGWSIQVGRRLEAEYCTNANMKCPQIGTHPLIDLPQTTALFTSSLIACWAQSYSKLGLEPNLKATSSYLHPPLPLVSLIVTWLQLSPPYLLLTPLTDPNIVSSLPVGSPFPPVTLGSIALLPLLRWTVEAPLFLQHSTETYHRTTCQKFSNLSLDDPFNKRRVCEKCTQHHKEEGVLYEHLHLQLMKCLHELPNTLPSAHQRRIMRSEQLVLITESLVKLMESSSSATEANKLECVSRLAMVLLVTSKIGAICGNTGDLMKALRKLPVTNRLMQMVLS